MATNSLRLVSKTVMSIPTRLDIVVMCVTSVSRDTWELIVLSEVGHGRGLERSVSAFCVNIW